MATKTITGSYPGGYYLNPSYQTLDIGSTANVGGPGVTASSAQPSTINNLGMVTGSGNGIRLNDGGSIVNGSTTDTAALIQGSRPIQVYNAPATLTNYGKIDSLPQNVSGGGANYNFSLLLAGGGTITNKSTGLISDSVSISNGGSVVNDGTIGGTIYWGISGTYQIGMFQGYTYAPDFFPSVFIFGGGKVTNGSGTNTSAVLQNGIRIAGGVGTVINNGSIGAPLYLNYLYKGETSDDTVILRSGGSITNGSATNSSAQISGTVTISGGTGTVTNYGTIGAVGIGGNGTVKNRGTLGGVTFGGTGTLTNGGTVGNVTIGGKGTIANDGSMHQIRLNEGGRVTNGSGTDFVATITTGGNGIAVKAQAGAITNFGSIQSTTLPGGPVYSAVELDVGGQMINGSAADHIASITGIVGITFMGAGTVTNFGLVAGTGGTAIKFTSPKGDLIEEGGSIVDGAIVGDGGMLEFAANGGVASLTDDVSGFKSITVDTGAAWVLFGMAANSLLSNAGSVINDGHLALSGQVTNTGSIINSANSSISVGGAATNGGSISNGSNATLSFAGSVTNGGAITDAAGATSSFAGPVTNSGAITNDAAATIHFGGTITNKGTIANDAAGGLIGFTAQVVNSGTIANAANATIDLLADFAITTDPATKSGTFANSGSLEKTGGTGVSIIRTGSGALSSSGMIDVEMGTLELTANSPSIGGLIEGPGTIEFGPGNTALSASVTTGGFAITGSGAHVTSATSLTYAGSFAATTNAELTLTLPSETWTLTGSAALSHATIDGFGHFVTDGATSLTSTTLGGSVQWENGGTLTETGLLTLASNGHNIAFINDTGAVFDLAGNVGIDGTGIGGFDNVGLLAKTVGSASTIAIALTNTGTVEVGSGMIDLTEAVTGTGTLQIDSGKILQADAAVAAAQTVLFQGTNDKLTLTDAADFHAKLSGFAATDKVDLTEFGAGTTLAYSGNTTMGTLTVTDGALQAKLTLLGQYAAAGFHVGTDSHGGSLVTYTPPPSPNLADHLATSTV